MRCAHILKSGKQCSRNAEPNSQYCWQHKNLTQTSQSNAIPLKVQTSLPINEKTGMIERDKIFAPKIPSPKSRDNIFSPKVKPVILPSLPLPTKALSPKILQKIPSKVQSPKVPVPKALSPKAQLQKLPPPPLPTRPPQKKKPASPKIQSPKIPIQAPLYSNTPATEITLAFTTIDEGMPHNVEVKLNFDINNKYIPSNEGYTNLESTVFFHLIKRASDRLALNTTNSNFVANKTQLNAIYARSLEKNTVVEVIPLEEIRQYTNSQKLKATLKAGASTIYAPIRAIKESVKGGLLGVGVGLTTGGVLGGYLGKKGAGLPGGLVGATVGGALAGTYYGVTGTLGGLYHGAKGTYQMILGDEYLTHKEEKLVNNIHSSRDFKYILGDVPFHIIINDLVFPITAETGETYTLYIEGIFKDLHLSSADKKIVLHGDASTIVINNANLYSDSKNKTEIKSLLSQCKNDPECLYFEPEI
jgi:hypothetical protein